MTPTKGERPLVTLRLVLLALTALVVGLGGALLSWRWLRDGGYRREDEGDPLPSHRWVLLAIPVLTGLLAWAGREQPWAAATAALLLAPVGTALVAVDADVHRLPNALTLPLVPVTLALLTLAAVTADRGDDLRRSAWALALVGGGFVLLSLLTGSRGVGMGDAKLVLSLAPLLAWHGWTPLVAGIYGAFLLGGGVALVLVVLRRADRRTQLAFGPYLIVSALLTLLVAS